MSFPTQRPRRLRSTPVWRRQLAESEARRKTLEERVTDDATRHDDSIGFHLRASDTAPSPPPTTGTHLRGSSGNRAQRRRAAREAKRRPVPPTEQ